MAALPEADIPTKVTVAEVSAAPLKVKLSVSVTEVALIRKLAPLTIVAPDPLIFAAWIDPLKLVPLT